MLFESFEKYSASFKFAKGIPLFGGINRPGGTPSHFNGLAGYRGDSPSFFSGMSLTEKLSEKGVFQGYLFYDDDREGDLSDGSSYASKMRSLSAFSLTDSLFQDCYSFCCNMYKQITICLKN